MNLNLSAVFLILYFFSESDAISRWNVDQNRLELEEPSLTHEANTNLYHPQPPSTLWNGFERRSYSHGQRGQKRRNQQNSMASFNGDKPPMIAAQEVRSIHPSKKDPADFYSGRIFINETEREKMQSRMQQEKYMSGLRGNSVEDWKKYNVEKQHRSPRISNVRGNSLRSLSPNGWSQRTVNDAEYFGESQPCVLCPAERTLIAARGVDRAALPAPTLQSCGGGPSPPGAHFSIEHGPAVGALLPEGSHVAVGNIYIGNKLYQRCQYRVNVVVTRCRAPDGGGQLMSACPRGSIWGASCRVRCKEQGRERRPAIRVTCSQDKTWQPPLPTCEDEESIEDTSTPSCDMGDLRIYGRLTCRTFDGESGGRAARLAEGSTCRTRCRGGGGALPPSRLMLCSGGRWQPQGAECPPRRRRHNNRHRRARPGSATRNT